MNKRILAFSDKIGTLKFFFIALSLYLFLYSLLILASNVLNFPGGLDLKFGYSFKYAYDFIADLGNIHRKNYYIIFLIDYFYLLSYSFCLSISISGLFKRVKINGNIKLLFLLPFLTGLFDMLENICISILLAKYPEKLIGLTNFSSFFTISKWVLFLACCLIIIFQLLYLLAQRSRAVKVK